MSRPAAGPATTTRIRALSGKDLAEKGVLPTTPPILAVSAEENSDDTG
jgi:hypothetical protein